MNKKHILFSVVLLLWAFVSANAQNVMKVHLTDGRTDEYSITDIDYIECDGETATYQDITIDGKTYHLGISDAIDLGLSVKWAAYNVGAEAPGDYGDYFAWGETETKSVYSWSTYLDNPSHDGETFTKYALDKQIVLDPEDDVAHVKWGGNWRMPTKAELDELREKCTWTWTTQNGVKGYVVTGPNGNSIFLPAAGYRDDSSLDYAGSYGYYWSSSLDTSYSYNACGLFFTSSYVGWDHYYRYSGRSVRAVCP